MQMLFIKINLGNNYMNKGFESTFKVIPINKIVLLRKSKVPHTFE